MNTNKNIIKRVTTLLVPFLLITGFLAGFYASIRITAISTFTAEEALWWTILVVGLVVTTGILGFAMGYGTHEILSKTGANDRELERALEELR